MCNPLPSPLQLEGERNYHIFYRMLAGMTPAELGKLHLVRDPWKYNYLTKVYIPTHSQTKFKKIRDFFPDIRVTR